MGYNTAVQLHTTASTGSYRVTEQYCHHHNHFMIINHYTALLPAVDIINSSPNSMNVFATPGMDYGGG